MELTYQRKAFLVIALPILALILHVRYAIKKYGIAEAWKLSVQRKGSWTNDLEHLYLLLWLNYKFPNKKERENDPEYHEEIDRLHIIYSEFSGEPLEDAIKKEDDEKK